jgi:hypothetical protein
MYNSMKICHDNKILAANDDNAFCLIVKDDIRLSHITMPYNLDEYNGQNNSTIYHRMVRVWNYVIWRVTVLQTVVRDLFFILITRGCQESNIINNLEGLFPLPYLFTKAF